MHKIEHCTGCSIEVCILEQYNSEGECPCSCCLIKVSCRAYCNEYFKWDARMTALKTSEKIDEDILEKLFHE